MQARHAECAYRIGENVQLQSTTPEAVCREGREIRKAFPCVADACSRGTRKTSRSSLLPRLDFSRPRDSAYCIWLVISRQLGHCLLLAGLFPDAKKFGLDLGAPSSGDRIEDVALLMQETALAGCRRKQCLHGGKPPIMPIGHEQIDVCGPS